MQVIRACPPPWFEIQQSFVTGKNATGRPELGTLVFPSRRAEKKPGSAPISNPTRLSFDVAAVALAFLDLGFGRALFVGRERPSHVHLFLEFSLFVAADITPVPFVRLDDGTFGCLTFFLCWHFVFLVYR
jgi:hypothetical protein